MFRAVTSTIGLKTYFSGREKFQGETLDWVWFDEEPPSDIYTEGLTRTNVGANPVWMTFTPLQGVSTVVKRFLHEKSDDRYKVVMTIDDVEHYSEDEKKKIISSYPAHEVEARTKGHSHSRLRSYFSGFGGIDLLRASRFSAALASHRRHGFWLDHPFAAVEMVWDRDTDTVYVVKTHRLKEATPPLHAAAIERWGKDLPWAWPRDGRRETLEGAGVALVNQYTTQGWTCCTSMRSLRMVSVSVEAGLMDMLDRMQTGRFKVFKHLNDWLEEFRLYHRKDGKVVKEDDDLMAATRYALMMLRYASDQKLLTRVSAAQDQISKGRASYEITSRHRDDLSAEGRLPGPGGRRVLFA